MIFSGVWCEGFQFSCTKNTNRINANSGYSAATQLGVKELTRHEESGVGRRELETINGLVNGY